MNTDNLIIENAKNFYPHCNSCENSNNCQFKIFLNQVINSGITEDLKSSNFYKEVYNFYFIHDYKDKTFPAICGLQKS